MRSGHMLLTQSLNLARRLGDQVAMSMGGWIFLNLFATPQHTTERVQIAEEIWANWRHAPNVILRR